MKSSVFARLMWIGRATMSLVGLFVVLALMFATASTAFAGNGDFLKLGSLKNTATRITGLAGAAGVQGPMLLIDNNSGGANATALDLQVEPGRAPMTVNSSTRVDNLQADTAGFADSATNANNADKLNGKEASELSDPRGYAHVTLAGGIDATYPTKGVNSIVAPGNTNVYCFDLTFTPDAAVGSPFLLNSAVVATATPPNAALTSNCPETHRDAAVKTYASNDGSAAPINFQIVFI